LMSKQSSTYPRGYASGCFSPAALLAGCLSSRLLSQNVIEKLRWRGERTLIGECHCGCHDFADFLLKLFEIRLKSHPLTQNRFLQDDKRISLTLVIDFLFGSVMSMCRVGHGVAHKSIGHRLYEKRSLSCTHRLDHPAHQIAHGQNIHPIHSLSLNPVGPGRFRNVLIKRDGSFNRCSHSKAIVLADEDHRKFPQGCQIECFVGLTAGDRPFTEETDGHKVEVLVLGRKCQTCGKRNMASNDSVTTHETARGIHQMHGATFALAQACGFSEQLSHHLARIGTSRKTMPVVTIGANRVVIRSKCRDGPDCNGFFADIEMKESCNLCEGIHLRRFFFESANQEHLAVE